MSFDKYGYRVSNRLYEWIKINHSKNISKMKKGRTKENDISVLIAANKKSGINHHFYGQTKENNQSLRRMSENKKGKTKENDDGMRRSAESRRR